MHQFVSVITVFSGFVPFPPVPIYKSNGRERRFINVYEWIGIGWEAGPLWPPERRYRKEPSGTLPGGANEWGALSYENIENKKTIQKIGIFEM